MGHLRKEATVMAIEAVKAYFKQFGMEGRILEFPVSSATVELAAEAAGVIPARIAKTLSFLVDDRCILIVTAGDAKIDNAKYKALFHKKAKMLSPDEVDTLVGHSIGGVCPFAIPDAVEVYLDESLRRFNTVFPACGSSNSAIELTCDELYRYGNARDWVDVCKGWQEEA
jgi:prolyl-tRNA editing enzyme YbaK/EbsC (Cys-tRNA(Pro) deacylase)